MRRRRWLRPLGAAVAVLAALNVAVALAYTLPRTFEAQRVAQREVEVRALLREQRALALALERRADALRSNRRDESRFRDEVVCRSEAEFLELVEEVERAVAEVGLPADRRNFGAADVPELGLRRYELSLPATGSYRQLVGLVGRIETSEAFLIIEGVRLSSSDRGGASLHVELAAYCDARRDRGDAD